MKISNTIFYHYYGFSSCFETLFNRSLHPTPSSLCFTNSKRYKHFGPMQNCSSIFSEMQLLHKCAKISFWNCVLVYFGVLSQNNNRIYYSTWVEIVGTERENNGNETEYLIRMHTFKHKRTVCLNVSCHPHLLFDVFNISLFGTRLCGWVNVMYMCVFVYRTFGSAMQMKVLRFCGNFFDERRRWRRTRLEKTCRTRLQSKSGSECAVDINGKEKEKKNRRKQPVWNGNKPLRLSPNGYECVCARVYAVCSNTDELLS